MAGHFAPPFAPKLQVGLRVTRELNRTGCETPDGQFLRSDRALTAENDKSAAIAAPEALFGPTYTIADIE